MLYIKSTKYKRYQYAVTVTYATLMSNWIFNLNLVGFRSVVQLDQEGVTNGALPRVVVLHTKVLIFILAQSASIRGSAAALSVVSTKPQIAIQLATHQDSVASSLKMRGYAAL
jgi:hypothetical protein